MEKKYNKFYINDEICGYAMPLSRYKTLKSSSFVNVDTIIFDEFLPEKGGYNLYIPNEVELFFKMRLIPFSGKGKATYIYWPIKQVYPTRILIILI